MDEQLLAELDRTDEVRESGRSAVIRRLTRDFLCEQRRRHLDAQYECAYEGATHPLGEEYEGWEEEGAWPPE